MALDMDGLSKLKFTFREYDPATGTPSSKTVSVKPPKTKHKARDTGYVPVGLVNLSFELPPGNWFLDHVDAQVLRNFNVKRVIRSSYGKGSMAFNAKAGETVQLGHYLYHTHLRPITGETSTPADIQFVTFSCRGKDKAQVTAHCQPERLSPQDGTSELISTSREVLARIKSNLEPLAIDRDEKPTLTQPEDLEDAATGTAGS